MSSRGILNCGRMASKHGLKPRVGKTAASRKRIGRCVSKARRRSLRSLTLAEIGIGPGDIA